MAKCVMLFVLICVLLSASVSQWHDHFDPSWRPRPPLLESSGHHQFHKPWPGFDQSPDPPDRLYPVQYASVPQNLEVYPLPLKGSDHELMLNISWGPLSDFPARDYSLEVHSVTDTIDCKTTLMCYDYNIPGNSLWWLVPAFANPVAETCAVRPGCAYSVVLIAHPWDGNSVAEKTVQLDV